MVHSELNYQELHLLYEGINRSWSRRSIMTYTGNLYLAPGRFLQYGLLCSYFHHATPRFSCFFVVSFVHYDAEKVSYESKPAIMKV